jgi:putative endonuclease
MEFINRQQLGSNAELKAGEYLEKQGLVILEQNYRCYVGEIDLIMQDQEDVVFIEVRSRAYTTYGNALESISRSKMNKIIKAATHFLQHKKWLNKRNSRFDVVAIHPIAGKMQLEWIKNAFTIDRYW